MNTVLSLIILLASGSLKNDINTAIAAFVIGHLNEIGDMSIQKFADNCYTSPNSVVKFCRMLGFSGYTDFKENLFGSTEVRKLQLKDKMAALSTEGLLGI